MCLARDSRMPLPPVTLLDANVLIYANNADAHELTRIHEWLCDLFAADEPVGIPWLALWVFVRVATNPRLSSTPKPAAEALPRLCADAPGSTRVTVIEPGPRHAEILERLVVDNTRSPGTLMFTDAASSPPSPSNTEPHSPPPTATSAAFPNLRWINPLAPSLKLKKYPEETCHKPAMNDVVEVWMHHVQRSSG